MRRRTVSAPLGFAAAVAVLWAAGRGGLAAPPDSVDGFVDWVSQRGAATASVALVRLAALAASAWLAVLTTVVVLAEAAGAARLAVTAEQALPRALRRAAGGVAGAGLASATVLGGVAAVPAAAQEQPVAVADDGDGDGTVVMSVLADDDPPPASAPDPEPSAPPSPPPPDEWRVAPGDSFWSIAEEVVGEALRRDPSEPEVAAYWRTLVEANRSRLVTPDPDLLLPGQSLLLPTPATGVPGRT